MVRVLKELDITMPEFDELLDQTIRDQAGAAKYTVQRNESNEHIV